MARLWLEEMEHLREEYREENKAWELLHEEGGFEDTGWMADRDLSDLDGQETHMDFHTDDPAHPRSMKH
jgi:hypothetical protein